MLVRISCDIVGANHLPGVICAVDERTGRSRHINLRKVVSKIDEAVATLGVLEGADDLSGIGYVPDLSGCGPWYIDAPDVLAIPAHVPVLGRAWIAGRPYLVRPDHPARIVYVSGRGLC